MSPHEGKARARDRAGAPFIDEPATAVHGDCQGLVERATLPVADGRSGANVCLQ
jgi:hypothetical protein